MNTCSKSVSKHLVILSIIYLHRPEPFRPMANEWQKIFSMRSDLIGEVWRSSEKNYLAPSGYIFRYPLARRACFDSGVELPFALSAS